MLKRIEELKKSFEKEIMSKEWGLDEVEGEGDVRKWIDEKRGDFENIVKKKKEKIKKEMVNYGDEENVIKVD